MFPPPSFATGNNNNLWAAAPTLKIAGFDEALDQIQWHRQVFSFFFSFFFWSFLCRESNFSFPKRQVQCCSCIVTGSWTGVKVQLKLRLDGFGDHVEAEPNISQDALHSDSVYDLFLASAHQTFRIISVWPLLIRRATSVTSGLVVYLLNGFKPRPLSPQRACLVSCEIKTSTGFKPSWTGSQETVRYKDEKTCSCLTLLSMFFPEASNRRSILCMWDVCVSTDQSFLRGLFHQIFIRINRYWWIDPFPMFPFELWHHTSAAFPVGFKWF